MFYRLLLSILLLQVYTVMPSTNNNSFHKRQDSNVSFFGPGRTESVQSQNSFEEPDNEVTMRKEARSDMSKANSSYYEGLTSGDVSNFTNDENGNSVAPSTPRQEQSLHTPRYQAQFYTPEQAPLTQPKTPSTQPKKINIKFDEDDEYMRKSMPVPPPFAGAGAISTGKGEMMQQPPNLPFLDDREISQIVKSKPSISTRQKVNHIDKIQELTNITPDDVERIEALLSFNEHTRLSMETIFPSDYENYSPGAVADYLLELNKFIVARNKDGHISSMLVFAPLNSESMLIKASVIGEEADHRDVIALYNKLEDACKNEGRQRIEVIPTDYEKHFYRRKNYKPKFNDNYTFVKEL